MKSRVLLFALVIGALCLAPAYGNDITVVGPGLGGTNFALQATPDGGADQAWVETSTPNNETVFSATFRILADSALHADLEGNKVLTTAIGFGDYNGSPARILLMGVQRATALPSNLRFWVYARSSTTGLLVPYVVFNTIPDLDTLLRVEWTPGNPGILKLYKFGVLISQRLDLQLEGGQDIDRFRIGLPVGSVNTGTTGVGTLLIDEVELTRTITP